ncbi:DUF1636 domain-containing protein [uncultured Sphingomonas sp.]|uniref:DUF1636 domain-containing protein n=1 Tax=uncultured Sphingomonas sp. TaxID=158754 RepID=UPI00262E15F5|nr:DUF1636 domain-containing protein [uncultured Sphingomonas sp.]
MQLKPAAPGPSLVVCDTCRFSTDAREDEQGRRGGARLAAALRAVQASDPRYAAVAVETMPCLFACTEHCTVQLRAPAKVGYVLGRFTPDADAARALLDYAVAYAQSEHGRVPFKAWPEGVKGHFIVRIPPEGMLVE